MNTRLSKYELNSRKHWTGNIFLILNSRPLCHTLSKAWLTSRKTTGQYSGLSSDLLSVSIILWPCWMVEWAGGKPNWRFGIHSCWSKSAFSLCKISFSRSLEIIGKMLMGRYGENRILSSVEYHDYLSHLERSRLVTYSQDGFDNIYQLYKPFLWKLFQHRCCY